MNQSGMTNQQLFREIEELRARLDVAEQPLREADEGMQSETFKRHCQKLYKN